MIIGKYCRYSPKITIDFPSPNSPNIGGTKLWSSFPLAFQNFELYEIELKKKNRSRLSLASLSVYAPWIFRFNTHIYAVQPLFSPVKKILMFYLFLYKNLASLHILSFNYHNFTNFIFQVFFITFQFSTF